MIKIGQKVYSSLYGGRSGYVVKINGEQSPWSCKKVSDGVGVMGGSAQFEIIFTNGSKSTIPESLLLKSVQWEVFEEVIDEEKINELKNLYTQKQIELKEKAKREATERELLKEKLLKEYSYLEQGKDSSGTLANKNIRKELKKAFPNIKFTVKKRHYGSISISYENGIPAKEVEKIVNKYSEGNFNSMEDIYEYNNSVFPGIFGGARYIFVEREISEENRNKVIEELSNDWGIDFNDEEAVYNKFHDYIAQNRLVNEILRERTY